MCPGRFLSSFVLDRSAGVQGKEQLEKELFRRSASGEVKPPLPPRSVQEAEAVGIPVDLKGQLVQHHVQGQLPLQKPAGLVGVIDLPQPGKLQGLLAVGQEGLPEKGLVLRGQGGEVLLGRAFSQAK